MNQDSQAKGEGIATHTAPLKWGEDYEPGENLSSDGSVDTKAHLPSNLLQVNGLISSQINSDAVSGNLLNLSSIMINMSNH